MGQQHFTRMGLSPIVPCILVKKKTQKTKTRLWVDETWHWPKTALNWRNRPAFCIWPDRGGQQLCVWYHSSEFHQSHTGRNTSESRTHNCLPLKKHRWDFKKRPCLSFDRNITLSWWGLTVLECIKSNVLSSYCGLCPCMEDAFGLNLRVKCFVILIILLSFI